MSDDRQSLSDLAALTGAEAPAPSADAGFAPLNNSGPAPAPMPLREKIIDAQGRAYATGRRKDAVARVWIKPGSGKITVNGRALEVYFARPVLRMILQQPLEIAKRVDQYDLNVTCAGGG
ncbi:MAG: ribosomal protein, partial [Sphingomonas bacterium]|nr:ribosomal protein [Sphingomonas bacterium]